MNLRPCTAVQRAAITLTAMALLLLSCGSGSSSSSGNASDGTTGEGTGIEGDIGVRLIANAEPAWTVACDQDCPSVVTIHDETGSEVGRVDFEGSAQVSPLLNYPGYPNRALIIEWLPESRLAAHILNAETATSSKVIDFESYETTTIGLHRKPGSPWLVVRDAQGAAEALLVADLRSGDVHRFEATAPLRTQAFSTFRPFSFSEAEDRLAVGFADGRVQVVNTATFEEIAQVTVAGEELVGLSPNGTQLATRPVDVSGASTVRIHDLATGQNTALTITGRVAGWFSDDRLLTLDGQMAALVTTPSGERSDPIPSLRSKHPLMPSTTRWHVSELSEQVVLTNIETGEQRSAASQDDSATIDYEITGTNQRATAWALLGGVYGAETLGALFLDLDTGEIEVYRDRNYQGFVDPFTVGISGDGRSAVIRGSLGPGHLLSDGVIVEIAEGEPSFCSDGSIAFAGRPPNTGFETRDAIVYPSADAATQLDGGAVLGTQPHVICVS